MLRKITVSQSVGESRHNLTHIRDQSGIEDGTLPANENDLYTWTDHDSSVLGACNPDPGRLHT